MLLCARGAGDPVALANGCVAGVQHYKPLAASNASSLAVVSSESSGGLAVDKALTLCTQLSIPGSGLGCGSGAASGSGSATTDSGCMPDTLDADVDGADADAGEELEDAGDEEMLDDSSDGGADDELRSESACDKESEYTERDSAASPSKAADGSKGAQCKSLGTESCASSPSNANGGTQSTPTKRRGALALAAWHVWTLLYSSSCPGRARRSPHDHQSEAARESQGGVQRDAEAHAPHARAARAGDGPQHARHSGTN